MVNNEKVQRLVEALEKLAKLGNGELYGNSIGNEIAIKALEEYDGVERKWMC